jgi:hypothetical protein
MSALLRLIPGEIYAGIILAVLAFGWYEVKHIESLGAVHEVAALKKSSDELTAKANARIIEVAKNYADASNKTTETLNAQIQAADAQHTSDLKRVQDYNAYRNSHPAVASTGGTSAVTSAGTGSSGQSEDFDSELRLASVTLADALRDSTAALAACMNDRNDLTGKP